MNHPNKYFNSYVTALYFIVVTVTTVGYGDWSPDTDNEFLFVIFLELLGLAIFSYILGTLQSIERKESAAQIIEKKKERVTNFLNNINNSNEVLSLPHEIYQDTERFLDIAYKYEVNYIFKSQDFFDQLTPNIRHTLVFE